MTRLNLVLLVLLLASSVLLVRTAYESRRVFAALDRAQGLQRQLDTDFRRLDAEAKAQGTLQRVERSARERLHMRGATPAVTAYVVDPAASTVTSTVASTVASSGSGTGNRTGGNAVAGTVITAAPASNPIGSPR